MSVSRLIRRSAAVLVVATSLSACGSDPVAPEIPIEDQTWASSFGVNLSAFTRLESGVYILDQTVGTGATLTGEPTVNVYYAGYLPSGAKFDEQARPFPSLAFPLSTLIPGWKLGMQGMRVGGKRRLLIPSSLGYGRRGSGNNIPPNANLLFDVELIGIG